MEKKMTKKEMFSMIKDILADNAEVVAFCDNEIALLDKKSASKKAKAMSDTELANFETCRELISDKALKVSEIISQGAWVGEIPSTPKVTAWLKKLGATRMAEGKNVTFTLAQPVTVAVELETETDTEEVSE
jgi:hypothetical protein